MAASDLEWVTINNFRPGIAHIPGTNLPIGTAVEDGTYGCIANGSGALAPAPAATRIWTAPELGFDPDSLVNDLYVCGFRTIAPVFRLSGNEQAQGPNRNVTEFWVGFQWFDRPETATFANKVVYRFRRFDDSPTWSEIKANTVELNANQLAQGLSPALCWFASTVTNEDDQTQVGLPIVAFNFQEMNYYWPSWSAQNQNVTGDIPAPTPDIGAPPVKMVAHQGRVALFPLSFYPHGDNQSVVVTGEAFYWTKVNKITEVAESAGSPMGFYDGRFQSEDPTGWSCIVSITANEFFLMKARGGATVIRGDLDDPTVINLPNVVGCGFAENQGTPSPVGLVYCTENGGVYTWQGGDTSEHISPNMEDSFWEPIVDPDGDFYRSPSNNSSWRSWVVIPNGWLFDTDHGGWWRYGDPDMPVFAWHDTDVSGRWLYAATPRFTPNDTSIIWEFDRRVLRNDYSWKSHPMFTSMDRQFEAREIVLSSVGHGEVKITVHTKDGQKKQVKFEVDNDYPESARLNLSVKGTHLQVQIESQGFEGHEAPVVHEVRMGVQPRERISRGTR